MLRNPRVLVSLGGLALLATYVLLFPPQRIVGTKLDTCPMTLAGLSGSSLDLSQTVLDDLDPDDYLLRRYLRPDGVPVWLVIVYFQNARLGAHDPQLCYRSQGFQVQEIPPGEIASAIGTVPYQGFLAAKGARQELVYYFWYTSGRQVLADVKGWRDRMFLQGLRSNRSFGAFIRISTLVEGDPEGAARSLQPVLLDLAAHLPGFFPES
jgi:EpsI family protein